MLVPRGLFRSAGSVEGCVGKPHVSPTSTCARFRFSYETIGLGVCLTGDRCALSVPAFSKYISTDAHDPRADALVSNFAECSTSKRENGEPIRFYCTSAGSANRFFETNCSSNIFVKSQLLEFLAADYTSSRERAEHYCIPVCTISIPALTIADPKAGMARSGKLLTVTSFQIEPPSCSVAIGFSRPARTPPPSSATTRIDAA